MQPKIIWREGCPCAVCLACGGLRPIQGQISKDQCKCRVKP